MYKKVIIIIVTLWIILWMIIFLGKNKSQNDPSKIFNWSVISNSSLPISNEWWGNIDPNVSN